MGTYDVQSYSIIIISVESGFSNKHYGINPAIVHIGDENLDSCCMCWAQYILTFSSKAKIIIIMSIGFVFTISKVLQYYYTCTLTV